MEKRIDESLLLRKDNGAVSGVTAVMEVLIYMPGCSNTELLATFEDATQLADCMGTTEYNNWRASAIELARAFATDIRDIKGLPEYHND